jgi:DNA-binding winged helix-turn-helix (wHTH) protein
MTTVPVRGGPDRGPSPATDLDHDDVALVRWPDEEATLADRRAAGQATLLVLDPDQRPPAAWGPLEDWVREPFDTVDLYARRERLRRRLRAWSPARFDADGLLCRGDRWVALPPLEERLVRALFERPGTVVGRATLVAALYPETGQDRHRALDSFVRRTRERLAPLGLGIHTVRGIGYLLEVGELPG